MAKQGFATSDRRKVEILAAGKTVPVYDCGTVFVLTNTTGAFNVTLPSIARAGEGWWCRFLIGADSDANRTITMGAATDTGTLLELSTDGAEDVFALGNENPDVLTCALAKDVVGDEVEFLVANGQWFIRAITQS